MSKKDKRIIEKKIRKAVKNSDITFIGSHKVTYLGWGAGPSQTSLGKKQDQTVDPS